MVQYRHLQDPAQATGDSDGERDALSRFFRSLVESGIPTSLPRSIQADIRGQHHHLLGVKRRGRPLVGGNARQLLRQAYEVMRISGHGEEAVRAYAQQHLTEGQLAQVVAWCRKSPAGRVVEHCFWKGVCATIWLKRDRPDGSALTGQVERTEFSLASGAETVRKWLAPYRRWYEEKGVLIPM